MLFDGQASFLCLSPTDNLQAPHLGDLQQCMWCGCVRGQGPGCMPSPECCLSLVSTTVTLINSHLDQQKGHCGDSGDSCWESPSSKQLDCVVGFALLSLFGSHSGGSHRSQGIPRSGSSLARHYSTSAVNVSTRHSCRSGSLSPCWFPASPDPTLPVDPEGLQNNQVVLLGSDPAEPTPSREPEELIGQAGNTQS